MAADVGGVALVLEDLLDAASGKVRHHAVPGGRPLRSFRLDAHGLAVPEIHQAVTELLPPEGVDGAVVRLFVDQARPEIRRLLDRRVVGEAFAGALHVAVQVEAAPEEGAAQAAAEPVASLAEEWDRYLAGVPVEGYDRERLAAMGRALFERLEEEAAR
jgi:hypothetical protein